MRLKHFFIVALAAVAFASCAKDGGTRTAPTPERAAKIKVKLTAQGARSTGSTVLEDEQRVDNFVVFIFKADGSLDATGSSPDGETTLDVEASTAAKSVYVLVNTGEEGENLLETINTLDELLEARGALLNAGDVCSQTGEALWMSGNGVIGTFSEDAIPVATARVEVYFVAAKIKVTVVDNRQHVRETPIQNSPNPVDLAPVISIKDNKIVLLFANRYGHFFESPTPMSQRYLSTFLTGDNSYPDPYNEQNVIFTSMLSATYAKTGVYFYTFANDATVQPTILAIQSTQYVDGAENKIYYPAHFTMADLGKIILPGREYDLTLTLTGKVYEGGASGTTDPEKPILDATVKVTVNVNDWAPVTVGKEF